MNIYFIGHAMFMIVTDDNKLYTYDSSFEGRGRHAMASFIRNYLGFNEIEAMIIGHFHRDHVGGAEHLVRQFRGKVNHVFSSGVYSDGVGIRGYEADVIRQNALDDAISEYNIPHTFIKQGDEIDGFIDVLSPYPSALEGLETDERGRLVTGNPNDRTGTIVRFNHGDFSILLTGDYNSMRSDLSDLGDMGATIMQIPHHGDPVYVDEDVMVNVDPEFCILGTATESRIEPLKEFLNDLNYDWWHIGYDRDKRLLIEGNADGSFTTSESLPRYVKYNRGSLL